MRKILIIVLSFMLIPNVVFAEECETTDDTWCVGQSCLTNLQSSYNLWSTSGNTGKACIKVIAKRNGNTKTYLSGKNPTNNYLCSNGTTVNSKLVYSALPDTEVDVTECQNDTCYIPEVWLMDCGTTNVGGVGGIVSGGTSNSDDEIDTDINSGSVDNDDVTTNEDGQITGTTDASDTGVETYFIVLFVMVIISYMILIVSKKRNLFKNI